MLSPARHGHNHGLAGAIGALADHRSAIRKDLVRELGACGVLGYNWWMLVPLAPGLMNSPNELFSDLEIPGHPFATLMQGADLLAGLAMLVAFAVAGTRRADRADWLCMIAFSLAGVAGALFPETCTDAVGGSCLRLEVGLRLPAAQYVHIAAGVVEFGGITAALAFAVYRTWRQRTAIARTYRRLAVAAFAAYPLLGLAYLTNRLGAIVEGLFFIGFSVMVVTELLERTPVTPARQRPA